MRSERRRTKKLTLAFHFQFANQAAWKCETCRREGLERKRNCGWLTPDPGSTRPVWGRRRVTATVCPVSAVTPESRAWLEAYQAWKWGGRNNVWDLPARLADAFLLLENESLEEAKHGSE